MVKAMVGHGTWHVAMVAVYNLIVISIIIYITACTGTDGLLNISIYRYITSKRAHTQTQREL